MRFIDFQHIFRVMFPAILLWLAGCSSQPSVKERGKSDWVEFTLKRMTLEEKIGQMIMSRAYGYYYSTKSDEFRRLKHLIKDHKFGGFVFFQGDVYETAALVNRLQKMSQVPLLMAADFEWGIAMRIRRGTRFPDAMALGATRDTLLAYQMGAVIGREGRAIGIRQNLAPVADVNVNPDNPVINTRSFGEDPTLVARLACAFVSGVQAEGVFATAKHFPGHGDTKIDSHIYLPSIDVARERLDSVELFPFHHLVQNGVASVMVAHLLVPALEWKYELPATLSQSIIKDVLQDQLGFRGLIVTDAMDMGALVNKYGSDSAAVMGVEAGVDVLLILPDEDAAVEAILKAVQTGRIPEERIDRSVRKILGMKWDAGLVQNRFVDLEKVAEKVSTPANLQLAKRIARKAITLIRNDSILPLERNGSQKILNLIIADVESYRTEIHRPTNQWPNEPVGHYFEALFRLRSSNVQTMIVDPTMNDLDFEQLYQFATAADVIVCPIFSKARSGSGRFGLPQKLVSLIDSIASLEKPLILIAMGSPYVLNAFPSASAYLFSYSDCEVSTEATVEALFGEIPIQGKLPVTIPNLFSYDSGIYFPQAVLRKDVPENEGLCGDSLRMVDSIIIASIRDSAFPGAQVVVVRNGAIIYSQAFGSLKYSTNSPSVDMRTIYDLASLTKVVGTTSAIMKLYEEGKIHLDDKVVNYIPEFGSLGKEKLTIKNLLLHNGGLPPYKRLFMTCHSSQEILDSVYDLALIYPPGDSTIYSDFDFIVLGKVVEKVSGISIEEYLRLNFYDPLGMKRTMFTPPESLMANIAPTEFDSVYRKKLVQGVVHDENAYALGGVAGHAGLFSTASDLAIFMQMIMNGGSYGGKRYLKPNTIKLFIKRQGSQSTRALGWDTKTLKGYSTAGKLFGSKSFGHTGFTGTSIWADPERDIFVIFLTNRVYPTRNNHRIIKVRPVLHDAVMRALYQ